VHLILERSGAERAISKWEDVKSDLNDVEGKVQVSQLEVDVLDLTLLRLVIVLLGRCLIVLLLHGLPR